MYQQIKKLVAQIPLCLPGVKFSFKCVLILLLFSAHCLTVIKRLPVCPENQQYQYQCETPSLPLKWYELQRLPLIILMLIILNNLHKINTKLNLYKSNYKRQQDLVLVLTQRTPENERKNPQNHKTKINLGLTVSQKRDLDTKIKHVYLKYFCF